MLHPQHRHPHRLHAQARRPLGTLFTPDVAQPLTLRCVSQPLFSNTCNSVPVVPASDCAAACELKTSGATPRVHSRLRLRSVYPHVPVKVIAGSGTNGMLDAVLSGECVGGMAADQDLRWTMGGGDPDGRYCPLEFAGEPSVAAFSYAVPFTSDAARFPPEAIRAFDLALDVLMWSGNLSTQGSQRFIPTMRPDSQCAAYLAAFNAPPNPDGSLDPLTSGDMAGIFFLQARPRPLGRGHSCWLPSPSPDQSHLFFCALPIRCVDAPAAPQAFGAIVALTYYYSQQGRKRFRAWRMGAHAAAGSAPVAKRSTRSKRASGPSSSSRSKRASGRSSAGGEAAPAVGADLVAAEEVFEFPLDLPRGDEGSRRPLPLRGVALRPGRHHPAEATPPRRQKSRRPIRCRPRERPPSLCASRTVLLLLLPSPSGQAEQDPPATRGMASDIAASASLRAAASSPRTWSSLNSAGSPGYSWRPALRQSGERGPPHSLSFLLHRRTCPPPPPLLGRSSALASPRAAASVVLLASLRCSRAASPRPWLRRSDRSRRRRPAAPAPPPCACCVAAALLQEASQRGAASIII